MATLVLVNGKIVTVDAQFSVHQAVAIDGQRVTRTGPAAVTGRSLGGERVLDKTITREQALIAHTRGNAALMFAENYLGSIAPGLLADMVVLDGNYLTVPEDEIRDIKPAATIVAGKIVHGALPKGAR